MEEKKKKKRRTREREKKWPNQKETRIIMITRSNRLHNNDNVVDVDDDEASAKESN